VNEERRNEIATRMNVSGMGPWQVAIAPANPDNECVTHEHYVLVYEDPNTKKVQRLACILAEPQVVNFLVHSRVDVYDLLVEVDRLHQLVKDAYMEGYQDALLREAGKIPHIMPYAWPYAKARTRLTGEVEPPKPEEN
jgi:hypothetical protein